jgi:ADP-ribosylglycohydrolase
MRVTPIGWAFDTLERVLEEAKKSAEVSHNRPQGIKDTLAVGSPMSC